MIKRNPRPLEDILTAIGEAGKIALICHIQPDNDTLGSALALCEGLKQLGKAASVYCDDEAPENCGFLPGVGSIRRPEDASPGGKFDLALCVDLSEAERMGRCHLLLSRAARTAQVDHHGTNDYFCDVNAVDAAAPATALIALELLERLGCRITRTMAVCLFAGLSGDTRHFSRANTTPEAFRAAAELMELGADAGEIYSRTFQNDCPEKVALLHRGIGSMRYYANGRVVSMVLTREDFLQTGAREEHGDILPDKGLSIRGVKMAVSARERADGSVKCSLRSAPAYDISGIAKVLGGGGHAHAAAVTIADCSAFRAAEMIVRAMIRQLEEER